MESIIKSVWDSFSGSLTVNEIIDLGYFKDYCELLGIKEYTESDVMFEKMLFHNDPTPPAFLKGFIKSNDLSKPFLERFIQYQTERGYSLWDSIVYNHQLSEECIEYHWKEIMESGVKWFDLIICQTISEDFLEKHWSEIDISETLTFYKLSDEFMESHWEEFLDYRSFYDNQRFSEEFIRNHWRYLDIELLIKSQQIPDDLLEEVIDIIDIRDVCKNQKLSEDILDKYSDTYFSPYWDVISEYQELSDEYIKKHLRDRLVYDRLILNEFIRPRMKDYIREYKTLKDLTLAC